MIWAASAASRAWPVTKSLFPSGVNLTLLLGYSLLTSFSSSAKLSTLRFVASTSGVTVTRKVRGRIDGSWNQKVTFVAPVDLPMIETSWGENCTTSQIVGSTTAERVMSTLARSSVLRRMITFRGSTLSRISKGPTIGPASAGATRLGTGRGGDCATAFSGATGEAGGEGMAGIASGSTSTFACKTAGTGTGFAAAGVGTDAGAAVGSLLPAAASFGIG